MLSRSTPLLKILVLVLTIALLVLVGAFARLLVVGAQPSAPRTELERATFAAEEAVKANPEDPASRVKLAAAYLEQKNYSGAVEQANIAVRLAPQEPSAYYILGLAQNGGGDAKNAIKNLKKAVETKGQLAQFYQDAYVALSRAQEKAGDMKAALSSMERALGNGPENAILLFEQGQLYERNKMWKKALENYGWALEYAPDFTEVQQAFTRLSAAHPDVLKELQKENSVEDTASASSDTTTATGSAEPTN